MPALAAVPVTSLETGRALGHAFFAAQDRLRGGPDPDLCAPDYVARIGSNPPMDRAGHEGFARGFYAGFPDAHHVIEFVLIEGDAVMVRFVIHGTHSGDFFGIPATGRSCVIPGHIVLRHRDGKVAELFGIFDEAGMLRQMGVV